KTIASNLTAEQQQKLSAATIRRAAPVAAQAGPVAPSIPTFQPDRLPLGRLTTGGVAEASTRIFVKGDNTSGLEVKTSPPPFARVKQTHLGTQEYGTLGKFVVYDVIVTLDTTTAGSFSGPLRV